MGSPIDTTGCLELRYQICLKGGVIVRSRNIQADILNVLLDGNVHTTREIASEVEVSQSTVKRHIQTLAYRYNIETFHGGDKKGGVQLIVEAQVSLKGLNNNDLQLIIRAIDSLQGSSMAVKVFSKRLKLQLKQGEVNENYSEKRKWAL